MATPRRRVLAVLVCVFGILVLTACDPAPVSDVPGEAVLVLDIKGVGKAELAVEVGHVDDNSYIHSLTARAASAVFADDVIERVDVDVDSNGPGWPFGVATAHGLYVQGRDPIVTLDVAPVSAALREFGFHTVRLTVCPPDVDAVVSGSQPGVELGECRRWRFTDASAAPSIRVEMHAEAWRGWIQLVFSLASALAAVIAWFVYLKRRDRVWASRLIIGAGGIAVILSLGALLFVGAGADELGVSGALSGDLANIGSVGTFLLLVGIAGGGIAAIGPGPEVRKAARDREPSDPSKV